MKSFQIEIPDGESNLLINRIEQDFLLAKASHQRWAQRCAGWMQKWEARVDPPNAGEAPLSPEPNSQESEPSGGEDLASSADHRR